MINIHAFIYSETNKVHFSALTTQFKFELYCLLCYTISSITNQFILISIIHYYLFLFLNLKFLFSMVRYQKWRSNCIFRGNEIKYLWMSFLGRRKINIWWAESRVFSSILHFYYAISNLGRSNKKISLLF